jgi:protein SCO1/2
MTTRTVWTSVMTAGALVAAAAVLAVAGCGGADHSAGRYEASPDAKRYPLQGIVRAVKAADASLTIAHEDIEGLMDAMTMDFHVQDPWVLKAAWPGDGITATLVLDGARSWLEGVALTKADSSSPTLPASEVVVPPGTPLPDVALVNQDGEEVRPSTFAGRAAVYTFIYTRCPLPDYCPWMMQRLDELAARLEAAGRRDDVWLVAVTLDPAFDTPPVLKAFGDRMLKAADPARRYARAALLTGAPDAIRTFADTFQLSYETADEEIVHGLRTVVVDAEGRVVRTFRGSDWTVDDLLPSIR